MEQKRILIVEDEVIVAMTLEAVLHKLGYGVAGAVTNGPDAIRIAGEEMPDLVLMDIRLEGPMDGIEAATRISTRYGIPVVYLTAHSDQTTLSRAIHTQPYGYLLKPFRERDLYTTIEMAFHKHRVIRQTGGAAPEADAVSVLTEEPAEPSECAKPAGPFRAAGHGGSKGLGDQTLDLVNRPVCVVDRDLRLVCFNTAFSRLCSIFEQGCPVLHEPVYSTAPAALVGTTKDYLDVFSRKLPHQHEASIQYRGSDHVIQTQFSPLQWGDDMYVVTEIADMTRIRQLSDLNCSLFEAYEEVIGLLGELRSLGRDGRGDELRQIAGRAEQVILALSQLDAARMRCDGKTTESNFWEQ